MKLKNIKKNQVVNCRTKKEAKRICKIADSIGLRWSSGCSYLEKNYWEIDKENTCYDFKKRVYDSVSYYKDREYEIIDSTKIKDLEKNSTKENQVLTELHQLSLLLGYKKRDAVDERHDYEVFKLKLIVKNKFRFDYECGKSVISREVAKDILKILEDRYERLKKEYKEM